MRGSRPSRVLTASLRGPQAPGMLHCARAAGVSRVYTFELRW
jgi:hypothetical protein